MRRLISAVHNESLRQKSSQLNFWMRLMDCRVKQTVTPPQFPSVLAKAETQRFEKNRMPACAGMSGGV